MTSEMEAAFEAAHRPVIGADLAQELLRELQAIPETEQVYGGGVPDEEPYPEPPPLRGPIEPPKRRELPSQRLELDFGPENPEHPGHALWLQNQAIGKLEEAYAAQQAELAELRRKPPKPPRTGAGARMNPDDIRLARGVLAGTAAFGAAAFVVSFGGQLAMAPYTQLQPQLYWFVPFVIEAPIILLSFMIAVFRRRKQSTAMPWVIVLALTALSSAINGLHVYIESDGLPTPGDVAGAVVMALAPWLVLLLFEEFVRLAVRPTVEHPETPAAAPAARKTPTRNRKGTTK